ncbi:hypothetical protein KJ688_00395 [bacterium]|nr:hypothetical protein [bacterium]
MKCFKILIHILILLFINCSKNINSVDELYSDEILYEKIIGKWTNENKILYTFFEDSTFYFSYYIPENDSTILRQTIEGKYLIEDGIISFDKFEYSYIKERENDTSDVFLAATSTQLFIGKLSFEDDILSITQIEVLIPQRTNQDEIWGKWEIRKWRTIYYYRTELNFKGYQKEIYEFYPDSNICSYENEYLFKCPFPHQESNKYEFEYASPYLNINGIDSIKVEIENNKMYWYYDREPELYFRVD